MLNKFSLLLVLLLPLTFATASEDWKGKPPEHEITLGGLAGLGFIDAGIGVMFSANAAKKIINKGFVPDINDQVFVEAEWGPLLVKSETAFQYSLHLRWDFNKDEQWTFFAIGGVGGTITGSGLGSAAPIFLRFGLGAFWHINSLVSLRAQGSHESIAAGFSFAL